ncbi:hypothetical protein LO80_06890 [Candidatus Francisella endociliophora]|uniref:Uncharacterized protein n=1 Tax=Candidatus Francisella endociliophora TaxID=653937 RepID=A0A097EQ69_9GAMM|nr:hypothetical protein [Francisella sp. FSC1006]AIT09715.1 hypothetical protein LO80_06890 [Francisella sp. FSC1006]
MINLKKILVIWFCIYLAGCVSVPDDKSQFYNAGTVEKVTLIKSYKALTAKSTAEGGAAGALAGGAGGAVLGAGAGLVAVMGLCMMLVPVGAGVPCGATLVVPITAQGAMYGAAYGAIGGLIVGAAGTYVFVADKSKMGLYEYTVILDNNKELTFQQIPDREYKKDDDVLVYKNKVKDKSVYHIEADTDLDN